MRASSDERHTIESQSVSSTTRRPPGRRTRAASRSASGMSSTYS